jgi:hypothetical protein
MSQIDTIVGNKEPSEELTGMLVDLRYTASNYFNDIKDRLEKIRVKAHSEGFSKQETVGLVKQYLRESLTDNQIRWLTYEKPRRLEQKKLKEKLATSGTDANMSDETITFPTEHKILPQDLEEITQEQEEQEEKQEPLPFEEFKPQPDYAIEDLKVQLDNERKKNNELVAQNKALEEKYKQLEARTRVSPSNSIPAVQGNTLRTKIVVNEVFREMLQLKGSKMIYANIVIDTSQNKYVRLEPI